MQDGDNEPQVLVEDDGELENIASNFKFVPWQSVAVAFPTPLIVDTRTYHPRGTPLEQVNRLLDDVAALVGDGELRPDDGKNLHDRLTLARVALQNGSVRAAIVSLTTFQAKLVPLIARDRLERDIALSLNFEAKALESWLEQGLR